MFALEKLTLISIGFVSFTACLIPNLRLTLDIGKGIHPFRDCLVHIILNHVDTQGESGKLDGSYELVPIGHPVVLSKHSYVITRYINVDIRNPKSCLSYAKFWRTNHRPKLNVAPQQIQNCAVVVYLDSPICYGPPKAHHSPTDFTYILYNELKFHQSADTPYTLREGIFIVHIGKNQKQLNLIQFEEWWFGGNRASNLFYPTILFFEIELSQFEAKVSDQCMIM